MTVPPLFRWKARSCIGAVTTAFGAPLVGDCRARSRQSIIRLRQCMKLLTGYLNSVQPPCGSMSDNAPSFAAVGPSLILADAAPVSSASYCWVSGAQSAALGASWPVFSTPSPLGTLQSRPPNTAGCGRMQHHSCHLVSRLTSDPKECTLW
jgi:hypothetical protein